MVDTEVLQSVPDVMNSPGHAHLDETEGAGEPLVLKLTNFLRLGWSKRKLVGSILVIGIVLTLTYDLCRPNVYTSTTTLMPPDSSSTYSGIMSALMSSSPSASLGSQALGLGTPGELYVSILKSRSVLDPLITRFGLARYYETRYMEDARSSLQSDTVIVEDRKSGVISVSVTMADPTLASNVARAYVEQLNQVVTDNSTSAARRERIFLEGRLKEVKPQLDASSLALSQFSTKSGAIDVTAQAKAMMDAGMRLQADLIDARSRLAALRQVYSDDNPRVRAAKARSDELQRQIDNTMGGARKGPESNPSASASAYPTVGQLPTLGLKYFDLERQVRVDEALWENLTKQLEMAKVQEAQEIPSLHLLDAATVPERKSGPKRRFIFLVGFILSFLFACVTVVSSSVWDEMDSAQEPKKILLDVTGAVFDSKLWIWRLPLLSWLHRRIRKPE